MTAGELAKLTSLMRLNIAKADSCCANIDNANDTNDDDLYTQYRMVVVMSVMTMMLSLHRRMIAMMPTVT
eukprot:scaffold469062_cov22-Prasinocladus_malaysianus.AAC.1